MNKACNFWDAPVSGGTAGAAAGSLTFMVGGAADALERARSILSVMGKNIFHAGSAGNGQLVKMCNNMLLAIHMAGTAEALALGLPMGLTHRCSPKSCCKALEVTGLWKGITLLPGVMDGVPASDNYKGGFMVNLMLKDLGLALNIADESHQKTPMGQMAKSLFDSHADAGNGMKDFSSIYQLFKNT